MGASGATALLLFGCLGAAEGTIQPNPDTPSNDDTSLSDTASTDSADMTDTALGDDTGALEDTSLLDPEDGLDATVELGVGQCRVHADCAASGDQCLGWYPARCGSGRAPVETIDCIDGQDCGMGEQCFSSEDLCGNYYRVCVPFCSATTCLDGFACRANGVCEPKNCSDDITCTGNLVCEPGSGLADPIGCRPTWCVADSDCIAGEYCVGGGCLPSLGSCGEETDPPRVEQQ
ncbi:MAG: hypothetical protein ACI9MR_002667 [Myxococcota bacterium]|jgi:hypothetical protein